MSEDTAAIDWDAELHAAQATLQLSKVMCYLCGQPSIGNCEICKMAVCVDDQHSLYDESRALHYCHGCFSRHERELTPAPAPVEEDPFRVFSRFPPFSPSGPIPSPNPPGRGGRYYP